MTATPIVYELPSGPLPAIAIGVDGWAGNAIKLPAPPSGVPIALVGNKGAARTALNPAGSTAHGLRLGPGITCWLAHLDIFPGDQDDNNTCILSGSLGTQVQNPSHIWMADVGVYGASGHDRAPMWGMQLSQTSVNAEHCRFDGARAFREHAVYGHNTPPLGLRFDQCNFDNWGGQCVKDVTRLSEGPNYGYHPIFLRDVKMREWGLDPSRASVAIDIGGAGAQVHLERVIAESQQKGGLAMWDPMGTVPNPSLTMRHVAFWCPNADRPVLQATCETAMLQDVYLGGPRASHLFVGDGTREDAQLNGINQEPQIKAAAGYLDENAVVLAENTSQITLKPKP